MDPRDLLVRIDPCTTPGTCGTFDTRGTLFIMDILSIILIVSGLVIFETVSSIDNAVINAEVLSTMSKKAKQWFLFWGILSSVFLVRGILPLLIVWATVPTLGPIGALTATFSSNPAVAEAIEKSSPILLLGGGTFLLFLFLNWLFMEPKNYGIKGERYIHQNLSIWFYAVVSILLTLIVWFALKSDPIVAFGAVVGSTAYFITHGFKQNAEVAEKKLLQSASSTSDLSKIFYLEVIDATFSIDGVLGAFAFTRAVPLILLGNGLGAIVVRQLTIGNIERIKKYQYLKNGAMYSILCLGAIMVLEGFKFHIPVWLSPVVTSAIIGYFFLKSKKEAK